MKKLFTLLIVFAMLLVITLPALAEETPKFTAEDWRVGSLRPLASDDDVIALCGEPSSIEQMSEEDDEDVLDTWLFDETELEGLEITMRKSGPEAYELVGATILLEEIEGPAGIKLGDSLDSVLAKFYTGDKTEDPDGVITYYSLGLDEDEAPLPPYCQWSPDENAASGQLTYVAPANPDVVNTPAYSIIYVKEVMAMFTVGVVDGEVDSMSMYYGTME